MQLFNGNISALFDSSAVAIFLKDLSGRYKYINRAGLKMISEDLANDGNAYLNCCDYDFFEKKSAKIIIERDLEIVKREGVSIYKSVVQTQIDGKVRWQLFDSLKVSISLECLNGEPLGSMGILGFSAAGDVDSVLKSADRRRMITESYLAFRSAMNSLPTGHSIQSPLRGLPSFHLTPSTDSAFLDQPLKRH